MANGELKHEVERFLAEGGHLSRLKPGYRARPEQMCLALAVADALEQEAVLPADAPTGTGKSFGYAIPAILKRGPVRDIDCLVRQFRGFLLEKGLPANPAKAIHLSGKFFYCGGRACRRLGPSLLPGDAASLLTSTLALAFSHILTTSLLSSGAADFHRTRLGEHTLRLRIGAHPHGSFGVS